MSEEVVGSKRTLPEENFLNGLIRKSTEKEAEKSQVQGYGSQNGSQHPFYRTTSKQYGWFPPDDHTVPSVYFPRRQKFSMHLTAAGMYRNHSLNTRLDPSPYL